MSDELDLDAILGDIPRPRDQHYIFAHIALPKLVLGLNRSDSGGLNPNGPQGRPRERAGREAAGFGLNPNRVDIAGQLADPGFFRSMWDDLANIVEHEPISHAGLEVSYRKADELEAMILTLPTAKIPGEAIMIAVVRRPIRRWLVFSGHALRYFTLELGMNFTDDLQPAGYRTVLCEWSKDRHSNYGDGPDAEVDLFAAAAFAKCRP